MSGTFVYDPDTPLTVTQPTGAEIYVGAVMGWTGTVGAYSFPDADDRLFALDWCMPLDVGSHIRRQR